MPARQDEYRRQRQIAVAQPVDVVLHAHPFQHAVDDAVIRVEHPQEDNAAGRHGDISRHEDQRAHGAIGPRQAVEQVRQQQAQSQIDGNVEECIDERHLDRVEQILGGRLGGKQPDPVFEADILIGAAGQSPVGEADVDELGDGIIGGQNQQQHRGQRHEKIRPVVPFRAQLNLPTLNLDAATLLCHGILSLKRRGTGKPIPRCGLMCVMLITRQPACR